MDIDFISLLAGLGFFLLGMQQLEESLKRLAGRSVKRLLRERTRSPLQGIGAGVVATAILQSSSLVTLMLLAFVGAGILTLGNAVGVVLGANLGTTVTGWLVAALGFRLDLEAAAFPLIGFGALGTVFLRAESRPRSIAGFVLALGFLLFGLDLMKSGVEAVAASVDLEFLRGFGVLPFAIAGFAVTAIIQSSSAAMLINLSTLAAGVITLPQAAAFAIGADLGTTITVLIGAIQGSAPRRRVAMAHFLFNAGTAVAALLALHPLLYLLTRVIGIKDPLFALVAFHSSFNLAGIVLFLPFVQRFARYLETHFEDRSVHVARFINQVPASVPDAAIEALQLEIAHLFYRVLALNRAIIGLPQPATSGLPYRPRHLDANGPGHVMEHYEAIKELEGEILVFVQELQEQALEPGESVRLAQLLACVRNAVQAAKSMKDVRHNVEEFESSVNDALDARLALFRGQLAGFYERMDGLWKLDRADSRFAELAAMAEDNQRMHRKQADDIYRNARKEHLADREISTLLNVDREIYVSNKSLLIALKDYLLPATMAEELAALPGIA